VEPTDKNRQAWDEAHRRRAEERGQRGIPKEIRELLPEIEGKHVLHLQSGTGEATAELVEAGALVSAVDISAEAIDVARERAPDVAYIHADMHNLPLELRRARFDLVFAGGSMHWIRDLDAWAGGIATALKPGGMLFLYDSNPITAGVDALGHWRDNYFEEGHIQLGHLFDALARAGLPVTRLVEFQTLYNWLQRDRRVPWDLALIAERNQTS
jgi:SAM-dependent methyltransferase